MPEIHQLIPVTKSNNPDKGFTNFQSNVQTAPEKYLRKQYPNEINILIKALSTVQSEVDFARIINSIPRAILTKGIIELRQNLNDLKELQDTIVILFQEFRDLTDLNTYTIKKFELHLPSSSNTANNSTELLEKTIAMYLNRRDKTLNQLTAFIKQILAVSVLESNFEELIKNNIEISKNGEITHINDEYRVDVSKWVNTLQGRTGA